MKDGGAEFYVKAYEGKGCPFRGGMNQLWRNQLLAMALEKEGIYKNVYFSVVHHPENKIGFVSPARRYEAPTVVRPPQM